MCYEKKRMYGVGILLSAVMLAQTVCEPVAAMTFSTNEISAAGEAQTVSTEETSVTVTTQEEFMAALEKEEALITITTAITIGKEEDANGKMLPVEIPAGTVIQGTEGASLSCRCPIQLTGDGVTIRNIEMTFESSDALGSVPHREIFLAGHSLTLDNVKTYLAGGGGSLGGFGGTEDELLPTVYAGGFEGTSIGTNASLTVQNANEKTMFQAIYMSHDAGSDAKIPYKGSANVKICPKMVVREGVYTDTNSSAEIEITGSGNVNNMKFYGNDKTTLTAKQSTVNQAALSKVGNLVLDEGAYFGLSQGDLENVTVRNKACLDLNLVPNAVVLGNFVGGLYDEASNINETGILVLNVEGSEYFGNGQSDYNFSDRQ